MQFLKKNSLVILYLFVVLLVFLGIQSRTGTEFLPLILLHLGCFGLAYAVFFRYREKLFGWERKLSAKIAMPESWLNISLYAVVVLTLAFVVLHMVLLGQVPLYEAYNSLDYYYIAYIRQSIKELDIAFISYTSAFLIKAILPFFLLLTYLKNKKLFWVLLPIAIFYSLSLIQKSFIIGVLVPLLVYLLASKKIKATVAVVLLIVSCQILLVYITNPTMRASDQQILQNLKEHPHNYPVIVSEEPALPTENSGKRKEKKSGLVTAVEALYERTFLTTGKVASYWFEKIPSEVPYAKGCGYRFLAPALGCDYNQYRYERVLYDKIYQKEAALGFTGTITAVHFAYDYANFGLWGMAYSGIILALVFVAIGYFFEDKFTWLISLNTLPVLWLSSASLSSTLLSGGWGPIILLFILYRPFLFPQTKGETFPK